MEIWLTEREDEEEKMPTLWGSLRGSLVRSRRAVTAWAVLEYVGQVPERLSLERIELAKKSLTLN